MDGTVAYRRARDRKPMEKGFVRFLWRTFEHGARRGWEHLRQESPRFGNPRSGSFQDQVVHVAVAKVAHPRRQMLRQKSSRNLHQSVRKASYADHATKSIEPSFGGEQLRQSVGPKPLNCEEHILSIVSSDIEGITVDVLTANR